jgi:hypothetical protein
VLDPSALNTVRVFRDGVEQAVYVEEIPRRHLDGTVRSVLVQCNAGSMANGVEDATWSLTVNDGTRTTTDLSKNTEALAFTTLPDGFLFYTNAQDRVASYVLLGPTATIANSPQREPFLKYHSTTQIVNPDLYHGNQYIGIKGGLDRQWEVDSASGPNAGDFFNQDIGWNNLHYWVRGGDNVHLERFMRYARIYIATNSTIGGAEWQKWYRTPRSHYWLTGDTRSVTYLTDAGTNMWSYHNGDGMFSRATYRLDPSYPGITSSDSRMFAQNAGLNMSAWLCGEATNYQTRARTVWNTLTAFQGVRGRLDGGGEPGAPGVHYYQDEGSVPPCYGQKDFMQGLMCAFMIEYVENVEPSLRADFLPWLKLHIDALWDQRDPTKATTQAAPNNGFAYFWSPEMDASWRDSDTTCDSIYVNNGNNPGRPRLRGGYLIEPFAYYSHHADDAAMRARAETVFEMHNRDVQAIGDFEGGQGFYSSWSIFGYGIV